MPSEFPPDDIRNAWQSQPGEWKGMSVDEIRASAERYQAKIRRRNVREYLGALIVVLGFAWFAWNAPSTIVRIGHLLVIAGALYVAAVLRRVGSSAGVPADLGRTDAIAFHRRELQRQLRVYRSAWRWVLALTPGLAVLMTAAATARPSASPPSRPLLAVLVVLGGWVLIVLWVRRRNQLKADGIRQELDRLARAQGDA